MLEPAQPFPELLEYDDLKLNLWFLSYIYYNNGSKWLSTEISHFLAGKET